LARHLEIRVLQWPKLASLRLPFNACHHFHVGRFCRRGRACPFLHGDRADGQPDDVDGEDLDAIVAEVDEDESYIPSSPIDLTPRGSFLQLQSLSPTITPSVWQDSRITTTVSSSPKSSNSLLSPTGSSTSPQQLQQPLSSRGTPLSPSMTGPALTSTPNRNLPNPASSVWDRSLSSNTWDGPNKQQQAQQQQHTSAVNNSSNHNPQSSRIVGGLITTSLPAVPQAASFSDWANAQPSSSSANLSSSVPFQSPNSQSFYTAQQPIYSPGSMQQQRPMMGGGPPPLQQSPMQQQQASYPSPPGLSHNAPVFQASHQQFASGGWDAFAKRQPPSTTLNVDINVFLQVSALCREAVSYSCCFSARCLWWSYSLRKGT